MRDRLLCVTDPISHHNRKRNRKNGIDHAPLYMTDEDSKDHNDIPVRARRTRHLVASATEKNKFGTSLVNKKQKK
jgi:hypothetical protein